MFVLEQEIVPTLNSENFVHFDPKEESANPSYRDLSQVLGAGLGHDGALGLPVPDRGGGAARGPWPRSEESDGWTARRSYGPRRWR